MKEKLTLFIALSFMIGLTVYKQSFNDNIKLSNDITVEASELNENIINEVAVDDISNDEEINNDKCNTDKADIDLLEFSEAFKYYRDCNYDVFKWNGMKYTTILKTEIINELDKNDNNSLTNKSDLVVK